MEDLLFVIGGPEVGGGPRARLELFGAIPILVATVEGTFTSDYAPSLVNGGTAITGRGGQTLQLDGGRPLGWLAGANWLITPHAGVQVFVGRASHAVGGANAPHRLQLTYLARQPPHYVEREYTYDRLIDSPDTAGKYAMWRVATNGLWRMRRGSVDLTLSAGRVMSSPATSAVVAELLKCAALQSGPRAGAHSQVQGRQGAPAAFLGRSPRTLCRVSRVLVLYYIQ